MADAECQCASAPFLYQKSRRSSGIARSWKKTTPSGRRKTKMGDRSWKYAWATNISHSRYRILDCFQTCCGLWTIRKLTTFGVLYRRQKSARSSRLQSLRIQKVYGYSTTSCRIWKLWYSHWYPCTSRYLKIDHGLGSLLTQEPKDQAHMRKPYAWWCMSANASCVCRTKQESRILWGSCTLEWAQNIGGFRKLHCYILLATFWYA